MRTCSLQTYNQGTPSFIPYGTAKVYKLKLNDKVDQLPIRSIISNIGTATYNLVRRLTKLLAPLSKSKYTIDTMKHFMEKIKQETVPDGYKMVSLDVESLLTNVPLEKTIDITLERIYDSKEINTQITCPEMIELLKLCTKNAHFTFNNQVYQKNDRVAMGSPLGPVLAGIFMVELETWIFLTLGNMVLNWKRFVDDTTLKKTLKLGSLLFSYFIEIFCSDLISSIIHSHFIVGTN